MRLVPLGFGFLACAILSPAFGAVLPFSAVDLKSQKRIEVDIAKAKRATILVFLSSRCPCSQSHTEELAALAAEFSSKGFEFVGIHSNVNENETSDQNVLKALPVLFPILEDPSADLADRLGAFKTPHVFVISPQGEVVYMGAVSDSRNFSNANKKFLRRALTQILEGLKVEPSKTVSMGCAIQRR